MSGKLRTLHQPHRPARTRRIWPGLLLALLAAIFLGAALLTLAGAAGLVAGLRVAEPVVIETATLQPTALVVVLPQSGPTPTALSMPDPAGLAVLAAAPLPVPTAPLPVSGAPLPVSGAPLPAATPVVSGIGGPLSSAQASELPATEPEPAPALLRQQKVIVTYADLFRAVGDETGLDWRLLAAVAYRESRLDPVALGRDGDMGLMQILPSTWDEFAPGAAASDPFNPVENARVAAVYLHWLQAYLLGLGNNDLRWVIVAYNWGPERVRSHLSRGLGWDDVPALQRAYVADILYAAFGE